MGVSHIHMTAYSMARRASTRRAMTLLELAVVVAIVGMLSTMAVLRYGSSTVADVEGQSFARRLALDCSQSRRRAIGSGDNHLVRFTLSGGNASQYAIHRRQGATMTPVDEVVSVPADVTVTTGGATNIEFTFTGEALASYTITVVAPDRSWTVTLPQVTGKAFVDEL